MAVLSWRLAALALVLAVAPSSSVDVMSRGRKVDGPKSERISGPKSDRPQKMGAQAEADAEVGGKIGAQAEADAEVGLTNRRAGGNRCGGRRNAARLTTRPLALVA